MRTEPKTNFIRTLSREVGGLIVGLNAAGIAVGGLMMYIGWQHNSQGEFHDGETIYWGYWFAIGLSWWVFVAVLPSIFVAALGIVSYRRSRPTTPIEQTPPSGFS